MQARENHLEDLRAHVIGCADHGPGSPGIGCQYLGDAKVAQLQDASRAAENVVALEVAMNNPLGPK